MVDEGDFIEIYCECPISVCEERDVKGLYKKARSGEIEDFTGISSPYEAPLTPELALNTGEVGLEDSVQQVIEVLSKHGIAPCLESSDE